MSPEIAHPPVVSIVMPAYNLGQFVGQAIESVLAQTFRDFELVIIDNGSTDNTAEVIRSHTDARIKFLQEPANLGPSLAVNIAILHSIGKYVALLAADDFWMPEKLARQVAYLDSHPNAGAVFSLASVVDEKGDSFSDGNHAYSRVFEQPNRERHEWLAHFLKNGNCLCAVSSLARRSVVHGEWYRPEMLQLSDFELWIRIVLKSDIHIIQERLTCFRVRAHGANTSGTRLDVLRRCAFEEASRIAPLFVSAEALKMAHLIFPEIGYESVSLPASVKKWRIAKYFTGHDREPWRLFGLMLQAELLADVSSRDKLVSISGRRAA
jgi:glycosyltransferase involved in cell wall biosynthesis